MFGYVRIYKDELKCKDFELFRSYYCGLCRALGKNCSQSSRLGLSYDLTFLSIVLSSLTKDEEEFIKKPCIVHPFSKRRSVKLTKPLEYSAHMSVILGYLKLCDDFSDDKSIKALIGKILYFRAFRKSKKKYKGEYLKLKEQMKRLSVLEKENCNRIDEVADCFAKMLEILFTPQFLENGKRELAWLGYNIGRWIYIIDAYADMRNDFKTKSYNPFLVDVKSEAELDEKIEDLKNTLDKTLTFTLENAASAYDLLKVYKNDAIIRNILYLGLRYKQEQILSGGKENENESL